ncbi:MAG: ATP-binding protein [Rhodobacter sp.]|jgi:hypothetical protein|nr:ATP-binding protein [Rhodobacter sp.]
MNTYHNSTREEFRGLLDYLLHPSKHIEIPDQLYGRSPALSEMRDSFETANVHPFIWGVRGIGKTSLPHTACAQHKRIVSLAAAISCTKDASFREIIDDIVADAFHRQPSFLRDKKLCGTVSLFGITVSAEINGIHSTRERLSVNQAARLIDTTFSSSRYNNLTPIIMIDEFDRLRNHESLQHVSDLLKQLSVIASKAKFCFCGVTDDLGGLLSAHQSVDRYIYGVELKPVSHDAIWKLIDDVSVAFGVSFDNGKKVRIGQIAAGYPHFAHLVLKNTLLEGFETGYADAEVSNELFRSGLNKSASQAATSLKTAYENAIRKGTDRYIEVLFALANSAHMNRQFKDVCADYERIMLKRKHREGYDISKNNGQDLRNALESLVSRNFLKKGMSGWYQFHDPMLRSYIRLVAETEGVELSDDAFPA